MRENTQEKRLVQVNENSIFYRIKRFFKKLFDKNQTIENISVIKEDANKNTFMKSIKNIEDEETKLLELQKQYRLGKIKGEDLSEKQIKSLGLLYDKQIASLRKSNEIRKQKLLEYRKRLQTDH